MKINLLTTFLVVLMAAPAAFADRPTKPRRDGANTSQGRDAREARAQRANRSRVERNAPRTRRTSPSSTTTRPRRSTVDNTRSNGGRAARVRRAEESRTRRSVNNRTSNHRTRPAQSTIRNNRDYVRAASMESGRRWSSTRSHRSIVNPYRPSRSHYGSRSYHSPYRYAQRSYNRYFHTPSHRSYVHARRYPQPRSFFRHVRDNFRRHIYLNWILSPSTRINGYSRVNQYPYYIHNGYRHRYSTLDNCNYQLVNKNNHNVVRTYWNQTCTSGYNRCALDRDRRNEQEWSNKFFCAETFRKNSYDFSAPTYGSNYEYDDNLNNYSSEDSYYNSSNTYNTSSNNNNNNDNRGICYDYDRATGVCYDN
jgi:hypothetical protein